MYKNIIHKNTFEFEVLESPADYMAFLYLFEHIREVMKLSKYWSEYLKRYKIFPL